MPNDLHGKGINFKSLFESIFEILLRENAGKILEITEEELSLYKNNLFLCDRAILKPLLEKIEGKLQDKFDLFTVEFKKICDAKKVYRDVKKVFETGDEINGYPVDSNVNFLQESINWLHKTSKTEGEWRQDLVLNLLAEGAYLERPTKYDGDAETKVFCPLRRGNSPSAVKGTLKVEKRDDKGFGEHRKFVTYTFENSQDHRLVAGTDICHYPKLSTESKEYKFLSEYFKRDKGKDEGYQFTHAGHDFEVGFYNPEITQFEALQSVRLRGQSVDLLKAIRLKVITKEYQEQFTGKELDTLKQNISWLEQTILNARESKVFGEHDTNIIETLKKFPAAISLKEFLDGQGKVPHSVYTLASVKQEGDIVTCEAVISKGQGYSYEETKYEGISTGFVDKVCEDPSFGESTEMFTQVRVGTPFSALVKLYLSSKKPSVLRGELADILVNHLSNKQGYFFGNGAGISLGIAVAQEIFDVKAELVDDGKDVSEVKPLTFCVGIKNNDDYLFEDKIEYFKEKGIIRKVHVAKSKEPANGVKYVQDLVPKLEGLDGLGDGSAWLVGCGSDVMGKGLRESLLKRGIDTSTAAIAISASAGRKKNVKVGNEVAAGTFMETCRRGVQAFVRGVGFSLALGIPSLFTSKHSQFQKDFKVLEKIDKGLDEGARRTDEVINAVLEKLGLETGEHATRLRKMLSDMDASIEKKLDEITKGYVTKTDLAVFLALSFGLGYGYAAALLWSSAGHAANYLVLDRLYEVGKGKYNGDSLSDTLHDQRRKFLKDFQQFRRDWTEEDLKQSAEELLVFATSMAKNAGGLVLSIKSSLSKQKLSQKTYELLSKIDLMGAIENILSSGDKAESTNTLGEEAEDIENNPIFKQALRDLKIAEDAIDKIHKIKEKFEEALELEEVRESDELREFLEEKIEELNKSLQKVSEEVTLEKAASNDNQSLKEWLIEINPSPSNRRTAIKATKIFEARDKLKLNNEEYTVQLQTYLDGSDFKDLEKEYQKIANGNRYGKPTAQSVLKKMKENSEELNTNDNFKIFEEAKMFQEKLEQLKEKELAI